MCGRRLAASLLHTCRKVVAARSSVKSNFPVALLTQAVAGVSHDLLEARVVLLGLRFMFLPQLFQRCGLDSLAAMITDLARAWEADETVRASGRKLQIASWFRLCFHASRYSKAHRPLSEVATNGHVVTRDALVKNSKVLILTIQHLGPRVGVPTLNLHLKSFYELIGVPVDGGLKSSVLACTHLRNLRSSMPYAGMVLEKMPYDV